MFLSAVCHPGLKTNSGEPLGPQLFLLHRLVKCNMEIFGRCRGNHMKGNLRGTILRKRKKRGGGDKAKGRRERLGRRGD